VSFFHIFGFLTCFSPLGEMCFRENVYSGKCVFGEMFYEDMVRGRCNTGKQSARNWYSGKWSYEETYLIQSYRKLDQKIQIHYNTVKKFLTKNGSPPQSQKIRTLNHSASTIRHQSWVEAPDAKLFLYKIDLQICDESYFTVD
jgi:hypothetical protein